MTNDKLVAEVKEGMIADYSHKTTRPTTCETRLSMVSRQYDINDDGVLDKSELASTRL